ncbi:unnamed protein product, partial [Trichogramma brassicae]
MKSSSSARSRRRTRLSLTMFQLSFFECVLPRGARRSRIWRSCLLETTYIRRAKHKVKRMTLFSKCFLTNFTFKGFDMIMYYAERQAVAPSRIYTYTLSLEPATALALMLVYNSDVISVIIIQRLLRAMIDRCSPEPRVRRPLYDQSQVMKHANHAMAHQKTIHEGQKNYVCDKCEKKFGQKGNLLIHQKAVHEGRKDYACDDCGKKFGQKSHLLCHQRTVHEGRKNYACDNCPKQFGRGSDLYRHQKIVHEGRKDFACNNCDKKFGEKTKLLNHLKKVHGHKVTLEKIRTKILFSQTPKRDARANSSLEHTCDAVLYTAAVSISANEYTYMQCAEDVEEEKEEEKKSIARKEMRSRAVYTMIVPKRSEHSGGFYNRNNQEKTKNTKSNQVDNAISIDKTPLWLLLGVTFPFYRLLSFSSRKSNFTRASIAASQPAARKLSATASVVDSSKGANEYDYKSKTIEQLNLEYHLVDFQEDNVLSAFARHEMPRELRDFRFMLP